MTSCRQCQRTSGWPETED